MATGTRPRRADFFSSLGVRVVQQFLSGLDGTLASACLIAAGILMPLGFFLGRGFVYAEDPGLAVFLVPPGALLLFIAVLLTAIGLARARGRCR